MLCSALLSFSQTTYYIDQVAGNDANNGISSPVKTIKRALQLASGMVYTSTKVPNNKRVAVLVAAGDYSENNPIIGLDKG